MTDQTRATAMVASTTKTEGPLHRPTTPYLVVRCNNKKSEVFIVQNVALQSEYSRKWDTYMNAVDIRFDKGDVNRYYSSASTDKHATFFIDTAEIIDGIKSGNTMLARFTPAFSNPQIATFPLAGSTAAINKVMAFCE